MNEINSLLKICSKCKKSLSKSSFYKKGNNLTLDCKFCIKIQQKEYKERNREKILACKREYYYKNRDRIIEEQKIYVNKNKEKTLKYGKNWRKGIRLKVFDYYGKFCICCGENDIDALEIDHKENNGSFFRRKRIGPIYRWLINSNFPEGFQVLCANCNRVKRYNNGILPIQRKNKYINVHKKIEYYFICSNVKREYYALYKDNCKMRVFSYYGNKCVCCGEDDINCLEMDHINNNGHEQRKSTPTSKCIFDWLCINNFPKDFQVLCACCNSVKYKNDNVLPEWRQDKYKNLQEVKNEQKA